MEQKQKKITIIIKKVLFISISSYNISNIYYGNLNFIYWIINS